MVQRNGFVGEPRDPGSINRSKASGQAGADARGLVAIVAVALAFFLLLYLLGASLV
jgi:hypothetical protein